MEVVYRLTSVRARVDDEPISIVEVLGTGDLTGRREELAEQGCVLGKGMRVGADVSFGDHENMDGSLWMNISEGKRFVGLVKTRRGDRARNDLAEKAVGRGGRHRKIIAFPHG